VSQDETLIESNNSILAFHYLVISVKPMYLSKIKIKIFVSKTIDFSIIPAKDRNNQCCGRLKMKSYNVDYLK
jgi:hypothetical protein